MSARVFQMWRASVVGDSLVHHLVPQGKSATDVFKRKHFTVKVDGFPGGKVTAWANLRQIDFERQFRPVVQFAPHLVLIAVGTNDLCTSSVGPDDVCSATRRFIERLESIGVNPAQFVVLEILFRHRVGSRSRRYVDSDLQSYNAKVRETNLLSSNLFKISPRITYWQHVHAHVHVKNAYSPWDGVHMTKPGKDRMVSSIRHCLMHREQSLLHWLLDDR